MTPRQHEQNANNALGIILQGMMTTFDVRWENTRTIDGHPGMHPDILIRAPGRSPVVIEAEYEPAREVEAEAAERLGLFVAQDGRRIEAVIALRYPDAVEYAGDPGAAIAAARLSYCVFTVAQYTAPPARQVKRTARFPETGWLDGSPSDISNLIRLVSVPQLAVDEATDALERGIERAASKLNEMDAQRPGITAAIARLLGMDNVPQTHRMAGAIIANAMVFHERIAGMHQGIKSLKLVCGPDVANPQSETLSAWAEILKINYWPIFAIGRDILQQLPSQYAARILKLLEYTVGELNAAGIDNAHDLTGRVFQRLISDRKYLATFYTLPASADLLARLAVAKLEGVDWGSAEAIGSLRIGDFACGTGALLSAVYEQIAARHENAGGTAAAIHPAMMEEVLYGCDVMPSAIHITGSTLSGAQPNVPFNYSRLYTMPYGRQEDRSVKIGSLELLQSSAAWVLFNTNDPALRTGSAGEETAAQVIVEVPDEEFDLVIMNPPFTRSTTHESAYSDTANAPFAAFNASEADQKDMGKRMLNIARGTCYHGNAGLSSAFAALAHRKLKPGGVMALVLPLSAAAGLSWQSFRQMLADDYADLTVVSIAANGRNMSFSSDTGMAECLVIARKARPNAPRTPSQFISLRNRPQAIVRSAVISEKIIDIDNPRDIEDGPYGGTDLTVGNDITGAALTTRRAVGGENWGNVRLLDYSLAQTAFAFSRSKLWLPAEPAALDINVVPLGEIANVGLHHRDITGPSPRGPFNKTTPSSSSTYPALWNHAASKEKRMICEPDSQLQARQGMESKAGAVWQTRSRTHLNAEFTFGSQALGVAFTERESIGGRVWPNIKFDNNQFDYPFTLWANSTLGLVSIWWLASRQQSSKISLSLRSAETLPTPDFRALTDDQLAAAETIFNEFRQLVLKPAYLADADPNRALLDRRVIRDLLGLDHATYRAVRRLAAKWCAEPSVHGGKPRPETAEYAE